MHKYLLYNEDTLSVTGGTIMKRYMRGLVAIITSLAFMGGVASAQAPSTCADGEATITNTGPGSTNEITCVDSTKVHVTCSNNIYVVNNSDQIAGSGDATNGGNTTGGSSITGNAINENGTTVEIGASCAPAAVVTTPPAPTPTPTSPQPVTGFGGRGAGAPEVVAVAALPNTSSNPILDVALVSAISLAVALVLSRLGILAYRQSALR
jgi:hypothetical protein